MAEMDMVISELKPFQRGWTTKVSVVRKFSIQKFKTKKGDPLKVLKLIVIDKEGESIQITLFNDLIEKFGDIFQKGKTYVIHDGIIKPIDVRYMSIHPKFEISLSKTSDVKEVEGERFNLKKENFCSFESLMVGNSETNTPHIDVIGGVIQIKPIVLRKLHDGNFSRKREVLLMDNKFNTIKLALWDDLAENEGQYLEENGQAQNVIVITNVKPTEFEGEITISSTVISVIVINPPLERAESLKCRMQTLIKDQKLNDILYPSKKMIEAKEVNMNDIIKGKVSDLYCSFIGRIIKIHNKDNPWFEKCNSCNERLFPIDYMPTAYCTKCENENSTFTRKYVLRMLVSDGEEESYITLFDAADYIVGCNAIEYFNDLKDKKKEQSKHFQNLVIAEDKKYYFLVRMDKAGESDRARKQIVVQEICSVISMASKRHKEGEEKRAIETEENKKRAKVIEMN